ncbi:MAG: T9SS type A sorting domain-containing protein [Saprospiraceae bacterium]
MKKSLIVLVVLFQGLVLMGQPYTINLQLQESIMGGCGFHTNCETHTICYDLYANPSVNGAWLSSYDIWYVINGGGGSSVVYANDGTCIITNNTDLPPSGATTFIRVGASQGTNANVINQNTLLHNFCMTYTTIEALIGSTLTAGVTFGGFNSNMSVNVNNVPTNAIINPASLTFSTINNSCITLPVTWLSFNATKEGSTSKLTWSTAQEFNNAGFVVENSIDGVHFEKIGEVTAGNSSEATHRYSFTDSKPFNGKNYYRIRQFDYDGNSDYSQIRTVSFTGILFGVRVWPNPVNSTLNIQVPLGENEKAALTLYNSTGQIVIRKDYDTGILNATLDVSHVDPGLYSLLVETQTGSYVERIVVVK